MFPYPFLTLQSIIVICSKKLTKPSLLSPCLARILNHLLAHWWIPTRCWSYSSWPCRLFSGWRCHQVLPNFDPFQGSTRWCKCPRRVKEVAVGFRTEGLKRGRKGRGRARAGEANSITAKSIHGFMGVLRVRHSGFGRVEWWKQIEVGRACRTGEIEGESARQALRAEVVSLERLSPFFKQNWEHTMKPEIRYRKRMSLAMSLQSLISQTFLKPDSLAPNFSPCPLFQSHRTSKMLYPPRLTLWEPAMNNYTMLDSLYQPTPSLILEP